MSALVGVLSIFTLLAIGLAIQNYQSYWAWPIARPRLEATWKMGPGNSEGFQDKKWTVDNWLAAPEVLTKPSVGDCPGTLLDAAGYEQGLRVKNYVLLNDVFQTKKDPLVAIGPTSQKCYQVDWKKNLERAGSYAQRTNNYIHNSTDSCSAPNHDLILDIYKPKN